MTTIYRSTVAMRWACMALAMAPAIADAKDGDKYACNFTQEKGKETLSFSGDYSLTGDSLRPVGAARGTITKTLETKRAFSKAHETTVRVAHDRGTSGGMTTISFAMRAQESSSCNAMNGNIPKCLATLPEGDATFQFTGRDGLQIVRQASMERPRPFSGNANYSSSFELSGSERLLAEGRVTVRVLVANREILTASGDAGSAALNGFLTQATARFARPGYLSSGDKEGYCLLRRY